MCGNLGIKFLFWDNIQPLIVIQTDLPLLLNHYNIFSLDRTCWLSIIQIGYQ